jgi:hypothetical protein
VKRLLLTRTIGCLVAFFLLGGAASGQTSANDTVGWGTLNYAVPESPAFKILGVSPTNIQRPATTRNIAVSIGNYIATSGATIPNNLAVAISPTIFNPKVTFADFRKNRWWYDGSISIGTKQNTNKSYSIAVGLSTKIIDHADLRTNKYFADFIDSVGPLINQDFADFVNNEAKRMDTVWKISAIQALQRIDSAFNDSTNKYYSQIQKDYKTHQSIDAGKGVADISAMRDSLKKALWNATVLEIGVAGLWGAKDSLIRNLSGPPTWGVWATLGLPTTKISQLLIGVNVQDTAKPGISAMTKQFNMGVRWYWGGSDTKGYIQGESKAMDHQLPSYDAALGIETTFFGGFWLDFALGLKKTGNAKWAFSPTINFNFGNGEKNKVSSKRS